MYYSETGSTDPCYNLAFEEYILANKPEGDWLLLWQNANAVVVGLNQNILEEIDPAFVAAHGITVVRRMTGGGAVYHDMGNLNYSFIADAGNEEAISLERFGRIVCRALKGMGVDAEPNGRNDITICGKKISGTAQRLLHGRILHHGTLLFDSNAEMISGALRAAPEKFKSKSAKSVRSRVTNIREHLPGDMSIGDFWGRLKRELTDDSAETAELSEKERLEVQRIADAKYRTWEWNYGSAPAYSMRKQRRLPGGMLEIRADIHDGRIGGVAFYGDFMARCPSDELAYALKGCRFERESVAKKLESFPIDIIFGSISAEEILDTFFYE